MAQPALGVEPAGYDDIFAAGQDHARLGDEAATTDGARLRLSCREPWAL